MLKHELVLRYLIDADHSDRGDFPAYPELSAKLFSGNLDSCDECANYLQSNGYVKISKTHGGLESFSLMLTDAGRAYFVYERINLRKDIKRKAWELFLAFGGVILGFILGRWR